MASAYISVMDFGAKGNGSADDQAALQNAFNYAKAHDIPVYIPPGTYLHSNVLRADGITVFGDGESTVIKATNEAFGALFLTGQNPAVYNLKIDGSGTMRGSSSENNGITVDHAQGFTVENIHVFNAGAAGIMNLGGANGVIKNNYVEHSFADAIHNTGGAHDTIIEGNKTYLAGDDGVAVVSYGTGPGITVYNITIQDNTVLDSLWGRGITVAGGVNVKVLSNHVDGPADHAGVYIAAGEWGTGGVHGVEVRGNTLIDSGGAVTGHGAITFYNISSETIDGVVIDDNQVISPRKMAILIAGDGKIAANIANTDVYADGSHQVYVSMAGDAQIGQAGNLRMDLSQFTAPMAAATGGVDPNFDYLNPNASPTPTPVPTPTPTPTPTPSPLPESPAPSTGPGTLKLHVSGEQWQGNPVITVLADGKNLGSYEVTASHPAGKWQDILINGVGNPKNVEIKFINDAYNGTPTTDRNVFVQSIELNGTKIMGTAADSNTAQSGDAVRDSAIMRSNGSLSFDTTENSPPSNHGKLTLHVSGEQWQGNPILNAYVDGQKVGSYEITANQQKGQWQDIVIDGVGDPKKVELKFINDAYNGTPTTDRNVHIGWIEVNGQKYLGTAAENNSAVGGTPLSDHAIMRSNGTISFDTVAKVADDGKITLHVSGEHWQGNPVLNAYVDGVKVGSYEVTADQQKGQWQDITIDGVGNPEKLEFKFVNDAYNGTPTTDRNVHVGWVDVNGHKILGTDADSNTAVGGTPLTDVAIMRSNGTLTFQNALDAPAKIAAAAPALVDAQGKLAGFESAGSGANNTDLKGLLDAMNHPDLAPGANHVISLAADGGSTVMTIDPDGDGPATATVLLKLDNFDPVHLLAHDYLWS